MGQREAALASTQEAVNLYRKLAQARPDAFEPDLAMSLENLARRIREVGRFDQAVQVAQETLGFYLRRHQRYPQIFDRYVRKTIVLLVELHQTLGKALDATTEERMKGFG